jgi:predicted Zn-dependent peptidase
MQERHHFRFTSIKAGEGVSAHVLPTRKFKTTTICLIIGRDLDERASHAALLAEVLKRGSAKYPDMRVIAEEMEEMYGASFGCGISRIGGKQTLTMRLTLPNERFLPRRTRLLDRGFNFMQEMLLRPLASHGAFNKDVVKREKANLQARIFSLLNDKMGYAQRRCIEEMCRTERFRFYEYGEVAKVARITPRALFDFYKELLATRPADVFVVGDVDCEKIAERVERMFKGRKPGGYFFAEPEPEPPSRSPRKVMEKQDMEQAKLCMGLRTHTTVRDPDYAAAVMYNGLLGGFSHSRLFRSIREKEALAYDAHSYLENSRGLMIVGVGMEKRNLGKVARVIEAQMDEIRDGKISRDEMNKTRKSVITRLRSSVDSPLQLMHLHYSQMVNGVNICLDEWVKRISAVAAADVKALAGKVAIDTIYVLSPLDGKPKQ